MTAFLPTPPPPTDPNEWQTVGKTKIRITKKFSHIYEEALNFLQEHLYEEYLIEEENFVATINDETRTYLKTPFYVSEKKDTYTYIRITKTGIYFNILNKNVDENSTVYTDYAHFSFHFIPKDQDQEGHFPPSHFKRYGIMCNLDWYAFMQDQESGNYFLKIITSPTQPNDNTCDDPLIKPILEKINKILNGFEFALESFDDESAAAPPAVVADTAAAAAADAPPAPPPAAPDAADAPPAPPPADDAGAVPVAPVAADDTGADDTGAVAADDTGAVAAAAAAADDADDAAISQLNRIKKPPQNLCIFLDTNITNLEKLSQPKILKLLDKLIEKKQANDVTSSPPDTIRKIMFKIYSSVKDTRDAHLTYEDYKQFIGYSLLQYLKLFTKYYEAPSATTPDHFILFVEGINCFLEYFVFLNSLENAFIRLKQKALFFNLQVCVFNLSFYYLKGIIDYLARIMVRLFKDYAKIVFITKYINFINDTIIKNPKFSSRAVCFHVLIWFDLCGELQKLQNEKINEYVISSNKLLLDAGNFIKGKTETFKKIDQEIINEILKKNKNVTESLVDKATELLNEDGRGGTKKNKNKRRFKQTKKLIKKKSKRNKKKSKRNKKKSVKRTRRHKK
jgi:hypothetical protein